MLQALEDEIVKQTNAEKILVPEHTIEASNKRMEHGRRFQSVRKFLPKKELKVEADVAWHILMSPGDYNLDLFKNWYKNIKYRIVYVFDTLQTTEKALINAFSDDTFNIRITSFNDAVPYMEKITGKKWYSIEQGVPENFFESPDILQRLIPFASYGRRLPAFHEALIEFTNANDLYYDYSTYDGSVKIKFHPYIYQQYSWHLSHSMFNVCWPVEITDKRRAGTLHPITCRWFEAASAGTCIVGKKPGNSYFDTCLHPDLVIDIDPFKERKEILKDLETIWDKRDHFYNVAQQIRQENYQRWTWKNRVERMLKLIAD
jgi:hypothetical protein